jgi:hypothetical protein
MAQNQNPNKIRRAIDFDKEIIIEFEDRFPGVSLWPVVNGLMKSFLKVSRDGKTIDDYIKMGAQYFVDSQKNEDDIGDIT